MKVDIVVVLLLFHPILGWNRMLSMLSISPSLSNKKLTEFLLSYFQGTGGNDNYFVILAEDSTLDEYLHTITNFFKVRSSYKFVSHFDSHVNLTKENKIYIFLEHIALLKWVIGFTF